MPSEIDASRWSGEGAFTQIVVDHLRQFESIRLVRVEDAPSTRSEADYNFISNEVFIEFATRVEQERIRRLGILPGTRTVLRKLMTMSSLEDILATLEPIGPPDYADEGMLQYLRTERIVPPYQTRGYKLVELLRIYEAGAARPR